MRRKRKVHLCRTNSNPRLLGGRHFAMLSIRDRGIAAIAVIVCLVIVVALGATVVLDLKASWEDFRQARTCLQADWLVASAFDRVKTRLEGDPAYDGEVWTINADQLDKRSSAEVRIDILRPNEGKGNVTAKVTIQLTVNGRPRLSVTRVRPVELVEERGEGQVRASQQ